RGCSRGVFCHQGAISRRAAGGAAKPLNPPAPAPVTGPETGQISRPEIPAGLFCGYLRQIQENVNRPY
ncbi:hypothetical protein, partial [Victivallis lenta]|uniref:hypothetical protein n=1 Tax=Victivallis lenta TaxID=2606640 RepID=UPI003AB3FDBC